MKKAIAIMAGLMLLCTTSHAFKQEEVSVSSKKMNKDILVTVITPDGYEEGKEIVIKVK